MNLKDLSKPFDPSKVHWRVGQVSKKNPTKATALCYIDARDVMERFDEVCGPGNWEDSYTETARGRVICTIRVKVDGEWVGKSDGAGDTAIEGEKGGISDAFKRAAVKWGVGRYLYDIPAQWVQIDQYKKILPSEAPKLQKALPGSRVDMADDEAPNGQQQRHAASHVEPHVIPVPPTEDGSAADWSKWAAQLEHTIRSNAKTVADVNLWLKLNKVPLRNFESADPDAHKMLVDVLTKYRAGLASAPAQEAA